MVKERGCFAQKALPRQSNSQSSCKVGTVTRYGKEESIQNGTEEIEEVPEVPWS